MSRPYVAFYPAAYLKKTSHLTTEQHGAYVLLLMECWQIGRIPPDDAGRAAVARLPLARWRKIAGPVVAYFNPDGTNNRALEETAKAELLSAKRAALGRKGGMKSGISRAIRRGMAAKHSEANEANGKLLLPVCLPNVAKQTKQTPKQTGSYCEANKKERLEPSYSVAATPDVENPVGPVFVAAGEVKPVSATRAQLEEIFASRRTAAGVIADQISTEEDGIPSFLDRRERATK